MYVLEQTTLFGVNYILVTDDEESEDGSFFVLKENRTAKEMSFLTQK